MARVASPQDILRTPTASAKPNTATTVNPISRVRDGMRAAHVSKFRTTPVIFSTRRESMGRKKSPTVLLRLSQADARIRNLPRKFSSISRATLAAVPPAFSSISMKGRILPNPACCTSFTAAAAGSSPNITLSAASRCVSPKGLMAPASSSKIVTMPRKFPAPSAVATPNCFSRFAAPPTGAERRRNMAFSDVPARAPCMPTFPNTPTKAATCSISAPTEAATGPKGFMASPNCTKVVFEAVRVRVSTSPTRVISFASREKPPRMLEPISAAWLSSMVPALARSRMPGMAAMIWVVLNPASPRNCIPSAACDAEKEVVAPRRRAVFAMESISLLVACVTARSRDIWASKSAATPIGPLNTAANPKTPAMAAINPDCIKAAARFTPAAMAWAWPVTVRTTRPMGPVMRSLRRSTNCRADVWSAAMRCDLHYRQYVT